MSKLIKITAEDCVLTVMAPPERGTFYRLQVYERVWYKFHYYRRST